MRSNRCLHHLLEIHRHLQPCSIQTSQKLNVTRHFCNPCFLIIEFFASVLCWYSLSAQLILVRRRELFLQFERWSVVCSCHYRLVWAAPTQSRLRDARPHFASIFLLIFNMFLALIRVCVRDVGRVYARSIPWTTSTLASDPRQASALSGSYRYRLDKTL